MSRGIFPGAIPSGTEPHLSTEDRCRPGDERVEPEEGLPVRPMRTVSIVSAGQTLTPFEYAIRHSVSPVVLFFWGGIASQPRASAH